MQVLLYLAALFVVRVLQLLPLPASAFIGRRVGSLAWWLLGRHRRIALENLRLCFPEKSPAETRSLARENFRRLGENTCAAVKTSAMEWPDLRQRVEFTGSEHLMPVPTMSPPSAIVATASAGNFELYARFAQRLPAFQCATTYRALEQPLLNRLMQSLREQSGCRFFERRRDALALRAAMKPTGFLLGLAADQHGGSKGLWLPFLGHDCSTSSAPAVFALRYNCPLHVAVCYRVGLARWRIEISPPITTHAAGHARPTEELMLEVNRTLEAAIRRDPANWFWPQRRWRHRQTAATPANAPSDDPAED